MNIISARNPSYNADGTITLLVTFDSLGEVPFNASPTDIEPHGVAIYNEAVAGTFGPVAPYVVTLAEAQAAQIAIINAACQTALNAITAPYPASEIATWPQQYAESLAYTANNTAPTPMLSSIAAASSQTVAALAASVITKATAYQAVSGAAIGKRQAMTAKINAATTVAAVQAIIW